MFMIDYRQINWWYWMLTAVLVTAGVAGYATGFELAIVLTVLQLIDFMLRERSVAAFTVQVRLAVLLYLLVAYPEPMRFLFWLPAVGLWARVLFGYCLMARTLSLMPWNRRAALTAALLKKTYLSRPVRGNIMQGLPPVARMQPGGKGV